MFDTFTTPTQNLQLVTITFVRIKTTFKGKYIKISRFSFINFAAVS